MLAATVGVMPVMLDDWTRWNLLYFGSALVLFICVFPELVRLERPVTRWIMRICGFDA